MIGFYLQNAVWIGAIALIIFVTRKVRFGIDSPIIRELIGGVAIGGVLLAFPYFAPMRQSHFLSLVSEIAISYFLFRVGFSATIREMRKFGYRALTVAIVGVFATLVVGFFLIPHLISGLETIQYVFIIAALTSTSVGVAVGLLRDAGLLKTSGARIVLAAAVIDDVVALSLLAIILSEVQSGVTGIPGLNTALLKIIAFVVAGIVIGQSAGRALPKLLHWFYPYISAKVIGTLIFFCAFFIASKWAGLSPIVGAFIGGLVLERNHFNSPAEKLFHGKQVEAFLETTSALFVPVFFVMTGLRLDPATLISLPTILFAASLVIIAVFGKMVCGLVAGAENNPRLVAIAMVPRGEIGLIFASVGLAAGLLSPELFSAIVLMTVTTTFLAPLMLKAK